MKTKNKLVNIEALIADLDNIEAKLMSTLNYVGNLKQFFLRELQPKRKKVK